MNEHTRRFIGHPSGRRWIGWAVLAGLVLAASAWSLWRLRTTSSPDAPSTLPPPLLTSSLLNTSKGATYIGTAACRRCHEEQYESYLQTAHSRSLAKVDPAREPPDAIFDHAPSRRRYRVYRAGGELRHAESLLLADGNSVPLADWPLAYLVGSGRFTRTYLVEQDGFFTESPVTWYASLDAWNMSPGYDRADHPSFQREIAADCLFCHAGQTVAGSDEDNRLKLPEPAIGCERCHGPGSLHAQRHERGGAIDPEAGDNTIANPRRLARDLSEAICHQCHLESAASATVRGRSRADFRPGLRWTDFCVNYTFEDAPGKMTVTGHVEQLHKSRCYQADATLTCITCHDPHDPPAPQVRVAHYRGVCSQCHAQGGCKVAAEDRLRANQNDCAGCHMPQSPTDIPHIAFTHHRIGIHAAGPPAAEEPVIGRPLVPVLDVSHLPAAERQRTLGLAATHLVADHDSDIRYLPYVGLAEDSLLTAAEGGAGDATVMAALAAIAAGAGDEPAAFARAEAALRLGGLPPADRAACNFIVASQHLRAGQLPAARRLLEANIQLRISPQDWFLLGLCRQRQQDTSGAIAALERVVAIDAAQPLAYRTLADWHLIRGDTSRAQAARQRAELLEANLPPQTATQ